MIYIDFTRQEVESHLINLIDKINNDWLPSDKEYKFEKELDAVNNSISGRGQSSLNTYFGSLRSQRNDPALSTAIIKY